MTLTIHQALKRKNKLAGEISKLWENIREYNRSIVEEDRKGPDVLQLLATVQEKINELIRLKCAVQQANTPILFEITSLAEIKGVISQLNLLAVDERTEQSSRFGSEAVVVRTYKCAISLERKEGVLEFYKNRLEAIQDKIDTFNATTKIYID